MEHKIKDVDTHEELFNLMMSTNKDSWLGIEIRGLIVDKLFAVYDINGVSVDYLGIDFSCKCDSALFVLEYKVGIRGKKYNLHFSRKALENILDIKINLDI